MKYEPGISIPSAFTEHQGRKYEKYGLDMIITPDELENECDGDPLCEKALTEMINYAIRYANDVWSMKLYTKTQNDHSAEEWREQHGAIDRSRSQLHNTYMDSIKILSRNMVRFEKNIDWMQKLAPAGLLNRAACGNFAIMLTYWISVNRRGS